LGLACHTKTIVKEQEIVTNKEQEIVTNIELKINNNTELELKANLNFATNFITATSPAATAQAEVTVNIAATSLAATTAQANKPTEEKVSRVTKHLTCKCFTCLSNNFPAECTRMRCLY
jgi:hypothetical protein